MRKPSETHEQLISLQRLCLDGHVIDFQQGFLTIGASAWSCTLRGASAAEPGALDGELSLRAEALDGRIVEGRVVASGLLAASEEVPAVVELAGLGAPLVEGHNL